MGVVAYQPFDTPTFTTSDGTPVEDAEVLWLGRDDIAAALTRHGLPN